MSRGTLNAGKLKEMIRDYCMEYIDDLAVGFMAVLAREFALDQTSIRTFWLQKALRDIVILDPVIEEDSVVCYVGWDYDTLWETVRVLVGLYGSGNNSKFGGAALSSKPGQLVWDHDLQGEKKMSEAQEVFYLPDEFNMSGNNAIENAIKAYKPIYDAQIQQIIANMPLADMIEACLI